MNNFTFKSISAICFKINMVFKSKFFLLKTSVLPPLLLMLFLFTNSNVAAQSYNFANFDVGTLTSGTSGVSVPLTTTGITGEYLVYSISANFVGKQSKPAWSNSIQIELNNGSSIVYVDLGVATSGGMLNENATTLHWTGILNKKYIGGDNLTIRFFDSYNDDQGPYTSTITNVKISISKAESYTFSSFDAGTLNSGSPSGLSIPLTTTGITGDYLIYQVSADFVGTGNPAWSNTTEMELNNGAGIIFKEVDKATSGAMQNENATTLHWTGVLNKKYIGGDDLTIRFFDSYNDASGPYTSSITNVVVSIAKANPHTFSSFNVGTLSSDTSGISTALTTTGVTGDYIVYQISADFEGKGNTAWSSTIEMELNDGSSNIFKNEGKATIGALDSGANTTLHWTGVLNRKYIGGDNLTIRFLDSYTDASGPYTCDILNVNIEIANFESSTLSIDLLDKNNLFTVYPVPFKNEVFVDYLFNYQTDVSIELYDIKGVLLKKVINKNYASGSKSKTKLNLINLNNQMFFVKLRTNKEENIRKITKH